MKILFISGTDTGIGKTLASALLCRELLSKNYKTAYMKATQTGAYKEKGQWVSADLEFVRSMCPEELYSTCPLHFELPASPHLAARESGTVIDPGLILEAVDNIRQQQHFDYLVVEGAGGLTVPFNDDDYLMSTLAAELEAQLIVVSHCGLGTLNHTRLTRDFAHHAGLGEEACVIISGVSAEPDVLEADNRLLISSYFDDRLLFEIPWIEGLDTEKSVAVNAHVDLNIQHIK